MKESTIEMGSNRSFGLVFTVFFALLAFYPLLKGDDPRVTLMVVSSVFLLITALVPKFLKPLNVLWFKFGILLGSVVTPVVMFVIFALVVTPIGFLRRLFTRDPLKMKIEKETASYWVIRDEDELGQSSMKNQY